jgi:hypothetical protein
MKTKRWKVTCVMPASSIMSCVIMFSTLLLHTHRVHKHLYLTLELLRAGVLQWILLWKCQCTCCQSTTVLSIIDQHYALSYITSLFDTQAPTYFGIHMPSSESFLCPHELLEIGNVYVVCSVLWMLVACVHWCTVNVCTGAHIHSTCQTT